jgi:hypothetical protein
MLSRRRLIQVAAPALLLPSRKLFAAQRPPFAFPAGVAPGMNQSHPVSGQPWISAVANLGGNFTNLLGGKPGTIIGAPTGFLDPVIGPSVKFNGASTDQIEFSGFSARNPIGGFTYGCIFVMDSIPTVTAALHSTANANTSNSLLVSTAPVLFPETAGAFPTAGYALAVGVPYFAAFSNYANGANSIDGIIRNLATGKVVATQAALASVGASAGDGTFNIGNHTAAVAAFPGHIAAYMYSFNFGNMLSFNTLLKWSENPWAYWYPGT